jgi:anti-sigma factor RsiW
MSAHPAVELLSGYLDAEVSPAELRRVEGHLSDCSECRRTVAGLRAVAEGVRRLEAVAPPATLAESVERRVRRVELAEPRGARLEENLRRWMAQPVLAPAFAIILALGAIVYLFAFGVARDESRGTRLVIASAPPEEPAVAETGPAGRVVAEGSAEVVEPPASISLESEDPARSRVARQRTRSSAAPVEGRSGAAQEAAASAAEPQLAESVVNAAADAALGKSVVYRELAGRRFVAEGAIWVEVGLEGEIPDEIVTWPEVLDRDASELEVWRALGRVRVRLGGRVVEVVYPAFTAPD